MMLKSICFQSSNLSLLGLPTFKAALNNILYFASSRCKYSSSCCKKTAVFLSRCVLPPPRTPCFLLATNNRELPLLLDRLLLVHFLCCPAHLYKRTAAVHYHEPPQTFLNPLLVQKLRPNTFNSNKEGFCHSAEGVYHQ